MTTHNQAQFIAAAVSSWLSSAIAGASGSRLFVRISGFDRESFQLLSSLLTERYTEDQVVVRSTGLISEKFSNLAIPADRSPTFYRNQLKAGQTLILLWLNDTADWESLKDLYEISDTKLCEGENRHYLYSHMNGLQKEDHQEIEQFLCDVALAVPDYQIQLRALGAFLLRLQQVFISESDFGFALGSALPELGFFAHPGIKSQRNKAKVLRELYQASTLTQRVIDEKEQDGFRQRVCDLELTSDSKYTQERKRELLAAFIEGSSSEALLLDWEEIAPLFGKKRSKGPKFIQWAHELEQVFIERDGALTPDEFSVVNDLKQEQSPNLEFLEELLETKAELVPRLLSNKLTKEFLSKPVIKHSDFLVALLEATVELANLGSEYLRENCYMKVTFKPIGDSAEPGDATRAFKILYGHLRRELPMLKWEVAFLDSPEASTKFRETDAKSTELIFTVELFTGGPKAQKSVLIHWLYDHAGPEGLTLQLIDVLQSAYGIHPILPVFTSVNSEQGTSMLGASRSLSQWRRGSECSHVVDLLHLLEEERKTRHHNPERIAIVELSAKKFCSAYSDYILNLRAESLICLRLDTLLSEFAEWQKALVENLVDETEYQIFLPLLNRAFVMEISSDTVMLPALHPLKLLAYRTKSRSYVADISRLAADFTGENLVNESRYLRNKEAETSTANVPPCLSLRQRIDLSYRSLLYAPYGESRGYELYRSNLRAASFTDGALEEQTLRSAAHHLARIVEDYLQTYPYSGDGLEITFVKCPGASLLSHFLTEILKSTQASQCRYSLLIHTATAGAGLYKEVLELVQKKEELSEKFRDSWFSQFDIKVISCSTEELFDHVLDRDLVFLVDCFRKYDQQLAFEEAPSNECELASYQLPSEGLRKVLKGTDRARQLLLNPPPLPLGFVHFVECQRAIFRGAAPDRTVFPAVYKVLSLGQDEPLLNKLHDCFNWVVCYDSNVDRHVLEQVCHQGRASVIRHLVGLGDKRAYNLTVSSSDYVLQSLQRRLAQELSRLLPYLDKMALWELSSLFSNEARKLSGDLVLRGVAPGVRINELLGVIFTHRQLSCDNPAQFHQIEGWIYLDDYPHWFSKRDKRPDLLRIRLSESADVLRLEATFAEAKCVNEAAYVKERQSAVDQVLRALELFSASWTERRLDGPSWRRELYNAIAQSCVVSENWEVDLLNKLGLALVGSTKKIDIVLDGHVLVVCHDGLPSAEDTVAWHGDWQLITTTLNYVQVRKLLNTILTKELSIDIPQDIDPAEIRPPFYEFEVEDDTIPEVGEPIRPVLAEPNVNRTMVNPSASESSLEVFPKAQPDEDVVIDLTDSVEPLNNTIVEVKFSQAQLQAEVASDAATLVSNPAFQALLDYSQTENDESVQLYALEKTTKLVKTLKQLNMSVRPLQPLVGPRIIRLKVDPAQDTSSKPTKIKQEAPNLKVWLAVEKEPSVWHGNGFVAIDIPRPHPVTIGLRQLLLDRTFGTPGHETRFPIGLTLDGELVVGDLRKTPHWLVGGSTGSGKSVFLRAALISLLLSNTPETLQLVLIDPKGGLVPFDGLPHFYHLKQGRSVIFGVGEEMGASAAAALQELTAEMDRRMHMMLKTSKTNEIDVYNTKNPHSKLPRILVVVEEYSDLLSHDASKAAVEAALKRLTQMGRSAGIHVMVITQNPIAATVNSTIKSNLVGRLAFRVSQGVNSLVILDETGGESLLGNGDFLVNRDGVIVRGQAPYLDESGELEEVLSRLCQSEAGKC